MRFVLEILVCRYWVGNRLSSGVSVWVGSNGPSLPRVAMMEDEEGNAHLKGLSMHLVSSSCGAYVQTV